MHFTSSKFIMSTLNFPNNQRIVIELNDGRTTVGDFTKINYDQTRLEVSNVKDFYSGAILGRTKYYYNTNIKSLKLLSEDADKAKYPPQPNVSTIPINFNQWTALENLIYNYKYIKLVDCHFHEAIDDLRSCNVVGLSHEGPVNGEMGRLRDITIITLSTPKTVYIFDVAFLQEIKGLKKVLSNAGIVKVMYNSKSLADHLCHEHNIELKCVFDVMLADHFADKPSGTSSLASSLTHNLNMHVRFKEPELCGNAVSTREITYEKF